MKMSKMVEVICYSYSKDYEPKLVDLLFSYAKEDVDNGRFSWELFFRGFRQAGKVALFFPKYAEIITEINNIKDRSKYINPVVNENLLTEGEIPDSEEVKQKIKELRNKMKI